LKRAINPTDIAAGISAIKLPAGAIYLPVFEEVETLAAGYLRFKIALGIE
jgi:hypothetical protein